MSDEDDPYRMRNKPSYELEFLAIDIRDRAGFREEVGPARTELARRQREHTEALVDRQLAAARAVRHATIYWRPPLPWVLQ